MGEILIIVAAGKSSRFGGYPKAFCKLGEVTNIENTVNLARPYFEKIYVALNTETYISGIADNLHTNIISIVTGQGDADSILKVLRIIQKQEQTADVVTVCWGDAVFVDQTPFQEMRDHISKWETQSPIIVGSCIDENPYAWFDTVGQTIVKSHFQKEEGNCWKELHDQSIFSIHIKQMIEYLDRYKTYLGLNLYDENSYDASRGEMKLLNAFTYFYEQKNMEAAEYRKLTAGKIMSFNTVEELKKIMDIIHA